MKATRINRGVIHQIAICSDCDWREEDFMSAARKGKRHCEKTGHKVEVETGISSYYEI